VSLARLTLFTTVPRTLAPTALRVRKLYKVVALRAAARPKPAKFAALSSEDVRKGDRLQRSIYQHVVKLLARLVQKLRETLGVQELRRIGR
jgi:hypothetical protein